jgi:hypothetical protein
MQLYAIMFLNKTTAVYPKAALQQAAKTDVSKKAGNCFWRYGASGKTIAVSFYGAYILASKQKSQRTVTHFTMDGKPAKVYNSMKEAADDTGVHPNYISSAINKKSTHGGGFGWLRGTILHDTDVSIRH